MSATPLLELRGLDKSFGPVQVLRNVDFIARAGEVTALVGDNGAGKSTLVKCIGGIYPIDSGEYYFDGKPVSVHSPRDASALGVEIVYQDLALCENLDIVQNMFLGREKTRGIVLDEPSMERMAGETLDRLSVRTLESVRQLADNGLAVVLISHNMNDVFAVADRIACLYLGRMAAQVKATDVTYSQVVELITAGRSGDLGLPPAAVGAAGTGSDADIDLGDMNGAQ